MRATVVDMISLAGTGACSLRSSATVMAAGENGRDNQHEIYDFCMDANEFYNSAITKSVVCSRIVVEMGSHLT